MRRHSVANPGLLSLCCSALLSCSALIDVGDWQCDNAAQCIKASLGNACINRVCVGEVVVPQDGGNCTRDEDCSKATPRCLTSSKTCVAQSIASEFQCRPPEEQATSTEPVKYSFKVYEFVSRAPPRDLQVKACRTNDVACGSPVAAFMDKDKKGLVELELPAGFLGFFEIQSPETLNALSYLTKPVRRETMDRDLQLISPSTLGLLATLEMRTVDPERGLALVEAFNCEGRPAGGIHFTESKNDSIAFYLVNQSPNADAMVSIYDADHDVADGGFLNVPTGFITFAARYGVDGPLLGEFNASVRKNTVTYIDMYF